MSNANYWADKDERKKQARQHLEAFSKEYSAEIENSINGTKIYGDYTSSDKINTDIQVQLKAMNTTDALFNEKSSGKIAVLNFASYCNPGGRFLDGSSAQEECLCMDSTLYQVLKHFEQEYYYWNRHNKNGGLYRDRALYSPDIVFDANGAVRKCDVITCAAPNWSAAERNAISYVDNMRALEKRISFMFDVCVDNKVDTLIAGAWGCGVFKQSPVSVAKIFSNFIKIGVPINKIVFAIPGDMNYFAFKKVLQLNELF